jgi:hypothetical protein
MVMELMMTVSQVPPARREDVKHDTITIHPARLPIWEHNETLPARIQTPWLDSRAVHLTQAHVVASELEKGYKGIVKLFLYAIVLFVQ